MDRAETRAIGLLIWLIVGIVVAYKTRKSDCGLKIICAILLTKGFVVFWLFYGIYLIIKHFIEGVKEGSAENGEQRADTTDEKGETETPDEAEDTQ